VQVFCPQFVELLLVEHAIVPKQVGLFVELCLKIAGQNRLYLKGVVVAMVIGEEFQQMLLGGCQSERSHCLMVVSYC